MTYSKYLAVFLCLVFVGPALFAGGGAEADTDAVELTFWGFADNRNQWYQDVADLYEAENPNVTINIETYPYDEMHDQLQTALVAGTGAPDIADVEISRFSVFTRGARVGFVPLNDYLTDDQLSNLNASSALDPWTWDGVRYGIGNELNPGAIYYRWDLMEEVGIELPIDTWEDFTEAGRRYVEETGNYFLSVPNVTWGWWWMIAQAEGGFFDESGDANFDNEFGQRVLQMFYDWVYVDEIATLAPAGEYNSPGQYAALDAGDFAVTMGAPWFQGFMKDNLEDTEGLWEMHPFPIYEDGRGARTGQWGGTGTVITEQSDHPDIAWDFIQFANFDVENLMLAFERFNLYPTWLPALEDERVLGEDPFFNNQRPGEYIEAYASDIPPFYNSPYWPEVTDYFEDFVMDRVLQDEISLEEAMRVGIEEARGLMEDF